MAKKGRILTGARCRFSIEGKKCGYARNVSMSEAIEMEPAEVLDNIEVEEHVPIRYRVTLTASFYRIYDPDGEGSVKGRGWFPARGGNTEEHLLNILLAGEMVATLEDTKSEKIWAQVHEVRLTSHNFTVDSRGIVGEDAEFLAVYILDETEI